MNPASRHRDGRTRRWTLAALSGVLLTLIYPPFSLSAIGWVALTPLIVALDGAGAWLGVLLGWLTGTIGVLGVTGFWIFAAARDYFALSPLGAALFTLGVAQAFVSVHFALFGFGVAFAGRGRFRFLSIPALFVATEYARAHLLSGCPWGLLGQSQLDPTLMQLCDLTGVYGLSFLLALSGASVATLRRTRVPVAVTIAAVVLVVAYGRWQLAHFETTAAAPLQVAVIQGNLPNQQRGQPEFFTAHLSRYLDLTRQADSPPPALIVWPENAIGFFPAENPTLTAEITQQLRSTGAALLAGAPRAAGRPDVAALYNSAYLFTAQGGPAVYDKRRLLPFVERVPLRPDNGPYLPGTEATIFSVAGTRFGALICYEAIYPELARGLVDRGAQLLVNISNDSWFDAGAGPEQHYEIARFRAVENRVSLVRVTNSGVSGVIDPTGREITRLTSHSATAKSIAVPLVPGGSFYSHHGDWFAAACIIASIGAITLPLVGHLPH